MTVPAQAPEREGLQPRGRCPRMAKMFASRWSKFSLPLLSSCFILSSWALVVNLTLELQSVVK